MVIAITPLFYNGFAAFSKAQLDITDVPNRTYHCFFLQCLDVFIERTFYNFNFEIAFDPFFIMVSNDFQDDRRGSYRARKRVLAHLSITFAYFFIFHGANSELKEYLKVSKS